jgi:lysophospholipase L1-like esterase
MFLPSNTGPATSHQTGLQTNYIANGDVSGNATLSGPQTTGSYYFLANLDVQNSAAQGAVVTLGASITDGVQSRGDVNRRWPNDLATRLRDSGRTVGVLNQGISGNRLLADGAGQSAPNRFTRDVLTQPGVRWVIFSDNPINDMGSGATNANQLITALQGLISRAHQAGIKFLCSTLTPFNGAGGWSQAGENARGAINSFVRSANSGCDGVVDQDTATHDPNNPIRYVPAFDAGDHLHPNEQGLQAIANAVNLALFGAGTPTPGSSLRSHANNNFVTAGTNPLIANGSAITTPQQFDVIDLGNSNIALRARVNNQYVAAEQSGSQPLIANRAAIGSWETFQLIHNGDGSVSFKAVNGQFVSADNAGANPLIANRTAIGPWEEFDLVTS